MAYLSSPAACCRSCARGGSCDSQTLGATPERGWFLVAGAALLAYLLLGTQRVNPAKRWYVYSKEPGAARAEFVHGPYTEGRARAQLSRERTMGLSATMRKKH